jgi:hypothetical protein
MPGGAILRFMAKRRRGDHPGLAGDPPDEVWVTVTEIPGPRGPSIQERVADIRIPGKAMLIGLAVVAAAIVAFVVALPLGGAGTTTPSDRPQPFDAGAAQVAAAYAYRTRCPSVARESDHAKITLAEFDLTVWCARYRIHSNSSIDQFVHAP